MKIELTYDKHGEWVASEPRSYVYAVGKSPQAAITDLATAMAEHRDDLRTNAFPLSKHLTKALKHLESREVSAFINAARPRLIERFGSGSLSNTGGGEVLYQ